MLSEFVLRDGSSILLGVAEWLTPNGDFIRKTGITPDVRVPLPEGTEPLTPDDARDLSQEEILEKDAQLRTPTKSYSVSSEVHINWRSDQACELNVAPSR